MLCTVLQEPRLVAFYEKLVKTEPEQEAMDMVYMEKWILEQKKNVSVSQLDNGNVFYFNLILIYRNRPITRYIEKGSKVMSTLEPFSIYTLS